MVPSLRGPLYVPRRSPAGACRSQGISHSGYAPQMAGPKLSTFENIVRSLRQVDAHAIGGRDHEHADGSGERHASRPLVEASGIAFAVPAEEEARHLDRDVLLGRYRRGDGRARLVARKSELAREAGTGFDLHGSHDGG